MSENPKNNLNHKILANLSANIDKTLAEDRRNALIGIRSKLVEKSLKAHLNIENIPQEIITKMQKYCQIVAFESDVWKVNYALKMFEDLIEVIFYEDFFESKKELEVKMANLVRRQLSSLPNETVPSYLWSEKDGTISQNNIYDFELPRLSDRYYDHLVTRKEQNGEWNLEENLKMYTDIERERTEFIETDENLELLQKSIIPYSNSKDFLTEFGNSGDLELQKKLVAEIKTDIETIILYIGSRDWSPIEHNPMQNCKSDQVDKRLKEQREGRLTSESSEYQQTFENDPKKIERNEEWLTGARSREGRYQELIIYRAKRVEKIRIEMQKIKDQMNIYPPETPQHKKLWAEFLYFQDCLLGLEKLANNEYGYYLWRKQEHENFLIDKIRSVWQNRHNSQIFDKKETKQKIKELTQKLKFTREYGYNWQDDNSKRPKGL